MKAFFLSRLLREKILLVALVLGAAAMWLSGAGKRAGKLWREIDFTTGDLKTQEFILAQKDEIEARSHAAVERFDPSRTFNPVRLQSEINTIANTVKLASKTNISGAPTETASGFSVHSVQVTINNADWVSLRDFYLEVQKRTPYIGIEQFDLMASPPNSPSLRQSLRISSFDFAR